MLDALPNRNQTAYRKAFEAAGEAIDLVRGVPAPLKSLADQVIRSAASVAATLQRATEDSEETVPITGELLILPQRKWTATSGFSASQVPCIAERQLLPCSSSTPPACSGLRSG